MTNAIENNVRGFEFHQSSPKRVKKETTTLFHLDQALLSRIMNLLPSSMVFAMVQVNKQWRDVICLNRAHELGHQGTDLIHAKEHIQYLWKGIQFFQQHDKRTGFGNLQLPRYTINTLPLFPRFPPEVD